MCLLDARLGLGHRRLTLRDRRLRFRPRGLRRLHARRGALKIRLPLGKLRRRNQILAPHLLGIVQLQLRHLLLLPVSSNLGVRPRNCLLRLRHTGAGALHQLRGAQRCRLRRRQLTATLRRRQLHQHLVRLDRIALRDQHALHPPRIKTRHIKAVQLQTAVGVKNKIGQRRRLLLLIQPPTATGSGGEQNSQQNLSHISLQ